jgi:uncharacterized membrane protein
MARAWKADLVRSETNDLARRRLVVGLSLASAALMALGALRQTGVIGHLPDPPGPFDSDAVVTSDAAYPMGIPDAPFATVSLAASAALASVGGARRWRKMPWLPPLSMAKAGIDLMGAVYYVTLMPTKLNRWCSYCLATAAGIAGVFALTAAEVIEARNDLA